jgi:DNA polymerase
MIWIDTETFSATPITWGTYRYAADAEVMLVPYAIADGSVECWDRTDDPVMPLGLANALEDPEQLITAHGAMFDRAVLRTNDICRAPLSRWRCTMAQAYCHGLPGGLGILSEIFKLSQDEAKDKRGKELIRLFCKPQAKNAKIRRATRWTHPTEWAEFIEYAKQDVVAMRKLARIMPSWNWTPDTIADWHLDQQINDRGFAIDVDLVHACLRATDTEQALLRDRCNGLTGGDVASTTQRDQLIAYILAEYGVDLPDLKEATVARRLKDENLPDGVKELLTLRSMSSKSCTSKYNAMLRSMVDGRIRGTLQFSGAPRTGRWAARTVQPHNFPSRNVLSAEEVNEDIPLLRAGCAHLVVPDMMKLLASSLRSCIIPGPRTRLMWADLSNVEGRCDAWLAGEEWKLQAFREFDAGTGPDLYIVAYARSFGVTFDDVIANKKAGGNWRQIGKVQELSLAREGGVGSFITFSLIYDIDLQGLVDANIPDDIRREATEFLEWTVKSKRSTFGLSPEVFIACDSIKRVWRLAHPRITKTWADLKAAAANAIWSPGKTVKVGEHLAFRRDKAWLRMILPDGYSLCYASPQCDDRGNISTMGISPYSHQWCRRKTYGGKFFAEASQATAARILKGNMRKLGDAGYDTVLHVHDEPVTEALESSCNPQQLASILASSLPWTADLPLAAKGYEDSHWGK